MRAIGVDGWRTRWIAVAVEAGRVSEAFIAGTITEVLERADSDSVVGVDTPIGLPRLGERRPSDLAARRHLRGRANTVFLTPAREMLDFDDHAAANTFAREGGHAGISRQTFALRSAIRQVDAIAHRDQRIFEVHPEVSFAMIKGGPLVTPKASWNGMNERRRLLVRAGLELPDEVAGAGVAGIADVLDATAAAWSAGRIASGQARRFPPGEDRIGGIWA